jgi:hypothetical protein
MLKRIASIIVLLVYVTVTAGFTVDTHFCGSQIAGVSFTSVKKTCGMAMNCCHDKHLDVKIADKHQTVSNDVNLQPASVALLILPFSPLQIRQEPVVQTQLKVYHSPPLYPGIPLTVVNSTFRI